MSLPNVTFSISLCEVNCLEKRETEQTFLGTLLEDLEWLTGGV